MEYIEHRIYHDYVGTVDFNMRDMNHAEGEHEKKWTPYEQDLSKYPEVFRKQYSENFEAHDKANEKFANEDPMEEAGPAMFRKTVPRDMSPWEKKYDDIMPRYTGTLCQ
jgi:hypothetical protein